MLPTYTPDQVRAICETALSIYFTTDQAELFRECLNDELTRRQNGFTTLLKPLPRRALPGCVTLSFDQLNVLTGCINAAQNATWFGGEPMVTVTFTIDQIHLGMPYKLGIQNLLITLRSLIQAGKIEPYTYQMGSQTHTDLTTYRLNPALVAGYVATHKQEVA